MNNDKAYLMGLIVGGGRSRGEFESFDITLPYRRWGSLIRNPERAGRIARDIMTLIQPIFEYEYGLGLSYETGERDWVIRFHGDLEALRDDLRRYGLLVFGEFRSLADIGQLREFLLDANLKRHFIAGLADTIGSLAPSHRRFTEGYQIVSFEFKGLNYRLVQQICQMLHEIGCYPDQVLWNHPNQHSSYDAYYSKWRKGFKIRVLLDQYTQSGSFFSQAKVEGARENRQLSEGESHFNVPCCDQSVRASVNASHIDESHRDLPSEIRGGHFLHTKHFCVVLGCPFAPVDQITELLERANEFVSPFTLLTKGTSQKIARIVANSPIMRNRTYVTQDFDYHSLKRHYQEDVDRLIWGSRPGNGYPVNMILQGLAYVSAAACGRVHGNRVTGNYIAWLDSAEAQEALRDVEIRKPDLLTPLIVRNADFASLVGPRDPQLCRRLVRVEDSLKLVVADITEDDLG
jgi:hypothetical protein